MELSISVQERAVGRLSAETLNEIRRRLDLDGYVVVAGLVSRETCEVLADSVLEDVAQVRSAGEPTPHERRTGRGHLQLGLRRHGPFVQADLVANSLLESVVAAVLGRGAWLGFYNGNVNCPGSVHQPLHFDRPFSWKTPEAAASDGQVWPPPTTTLSCSVALTDIGTMNGATEVYPGTHKETAVTQWAVGERVSDHPEALEGWGPPVSMLIPAGGVCFRDPRMWHRGVPNPTDSPRPMIALTYHAERCRHWRGLLLPDLEPEDETRCQQDSSLRMLDSGELGDGRLVFHESAREAFETAGGEGEVNRHVRFVGDPYAVNHFLDAHLVGGARVVAAGHLSPTE